MSMLTINGGSSSIKFALYQASHHWREGSVGRLTVSASPMRI
ncbi:MAG: hypothetical protein Q7T82_19660 [Armatimonadota bacterium]|nr:hypothetical protein [Armatimonadota bacterium]